MRKMILFISQLLFIGILVLPSLVWGILCVFNPSCVEALDFDLGEKRAKASFPSAFRASSFTRELENYYTDRIPFRSVMIRADQSFSGSLENVYLNTIQPVLVKCLYKNTTSTASRLDIDDLIANDSSSTSPASEEPSASELPPETPSEETPEHHYAQVSLTEPTCLEDGEAVYECTDCHDTYTEILPAPGHDSVATETVEASYFNYGYTEYCCNVCGAVYRDDLEGKLVDNSYLAPIVNGEGALLGRFNWVFYTGNDSISYYKGTNLLSTEKMEEYLGLMVRLQELCDKRGIRLQFMIMPNKEQVYSEYMPTYTIESTEKRVDVFVKYVRENSDVNIIYPLKELKAADLYWQTYYKYDTHWNYAGSFIGTQELYRALGMPVTDLLDVEVTTVDTKKGDLLLLGGLDESRYPYDKDYVINYKPEVQVTEHKGNREESMIYYASSDSTNQCNFVMLSDSYRVMMLPYLEKDFSHIAVAHRDYVDSLETSVKEADILVIAAVERYDNRMFKTVQTLIDMLDEDTPTLEP